MATDTDFRRVPDFDHPLAKAILALDNVTDLHQMTQAAFARRTQLTRADPMLKAERASKLEERFKTMSPKPSEFEFRTFGTQLRSDQLAHPPVDDRTAQMHVLLTMANKNSASARAWVAFIGEIAHPVYPWRIEDSMVVAIMFNHQNVINEIRSTQTLNNSKILRKVLHRRTITDAAKIAANPKIAAKLVNKKFNRGIHYFLSLIGSELISMIYDYKTFRKMEAWPLIEQLLIDTPKTDLDQLELCLRGIEVGNENLGLMLSSIEPGTIDRYFAILDQSMFNNVLSLESTEEIMWVPTEELNWAVIQETNPAFHDRLIAHPYVQIYKALVEDPVSIDRIETHPGINK